MTRAVLFLGSNLGPSARLLARARAAIRRWPKTTVVASSPVLKTAPEMFKAQGMFLNQAIAIETRLDPVPLMLWSKKTESELGRKPRFRFGPREIDIDILTYGRKPRRGLVVIPHPRLASSPAMKRCLRSLKERK